MEYEERLNEVIKELREVFTKYSTAWHNDDIDEAHKYQKEYIALYNKKTKLENKNRQRENDSS